MGGANSLLFTTELLYSIVACILLLVASPFNIVPLYLILFLQVLQKAIPLLQLESRADYKRSLASIYTTLCNMLARNSSRLEEATQYCREGVHTNQASFNAHNSLGVVLMHRGENQHAVQAFKKAVALNNTDTTPEFNLALAYLNMGQQGLAVQSLEKVLERDKDHLSARMHLQELRRKNVS